MAQMIVYLLPVFVLGIVSYLILYLSSLLAQGQTEGFLGFIPILSLTPAVDCFFIFVIKAVYFGGMVLCSLFRSSNHIIVTLDILVLFSFLMLLLFQRLKEPGYSPAV